MIPGPVFERFVHESPIRVMTRATIEHALAAPALDELFDDTARRGYTKELLSSTTVDLMSLVVPGKAGHVQAAFTQMRDRVPVPLKCLHEKFQRIETAVFARLVSRVADRRQRLVTALGGACGPLLPGYRVRALDGNRLAATPKRLKVTRGHTAGALPGQSLAVLDPALMLVTHVIPCEDAHARERALLGQALPLACAKDARVEGRNFCTADFLPGLDARRACFIIRRHGNLTAQAQEAYSQEVEAEAGWGSQRRARVCRDGERVPEVRQVRVGLKKPTADGDTEVEALTNLPAEAVGAVTVAFVYLKRWKIEGAFHELTLALKCEVNTPGYPKAALFAFCVAVPAYNALAVVKAAMRAGHGEREVHEEVSGYYVALEWALVCAGMMIALPAEQWEVFGDRSAEQLAAHLRRWAAKIDLRKVKKAPPRRPTKNETKRIKDKSPHLSTARLLEEAKKQRQASAKGPKQS
jgi:hypothetical protein